MNYSHPLIGDLSKYLQDIEDRIDPAQEQQIREQWRSYANGTATPSERNFVRVPKPSKIDWPQVTTNQALEDETLMLYNVYKGASNTLAGDKALFMTVRANYGIGILPNSFAGCRFFYMKNSGMLPNVYPMDCGDKTVVEAVSDLVNAPMPDVYSNVGAKVFSVAKKFAEIKAAYPKIGEYILLDHPDCQGPMDVCELVWGSEIFLEMYESTELVHGLLQKITDFYKLFMDEWFRICPNDTGYHTVYGRLVKGKILIRDDSAINLSPAFFNEFIKPYDEQLLQHFNGGAIHFCGKGDHFVDIFKTMKNLNGVDMSQPHLNDMDKAFSNIINNKLTMTIGKLENLDDDLNNPKYNTTYLTPMLH